MGKITVVDVDDAEVPEQDFVESRSTYESLVATDGLRYLGDAGFPDLRPQGGR